MSDTNVQFRYFKDNLDVEPPKPSTKNYKRPTSFTELFGLIKSAKTDDEKVTLLKDNRSPQLYSFLNYTANNLWAVKAPDNLIVERYPGDMTETLYSRGDLYTIARDPRRPSPIQDKPDRLHKKFIDILASLHSAEANLLKNATRGI